MNEAVRRLARLFDVRQGERRDVVVVFATLFSFMVAHGVLETARDALFLSRLPATRLPWVYVAMALVGLGAARLLAEVPVPRGGRRLAATLGAIALGTTILASSLARSSSVAVPYAIYIWVGIAASAATVEIWQLLGDRFTVAQAKRLFGLIGAGGVIGIAGGSALAAVLSQRLAPRALLYAGAAATFLAALGPLWLRKSALVATRGSESSVDIKTGPRSRPVEAGHPLRAFQVIRDEPHARRLLYLVAITTITLTVLDFAFKSRVAASIPSAKLGIFFGGYYASVNAAALLAQLFVTPWILRKLGANGLSVLPVLVMIGSAVFVAAPILGILLAVKAIDGTLRYTVQQTGLEVLFLPLPDPARRALKRLVEFVGQRGAQALASAGILVAIALGAGPRVLALAVVLLSVFWVVGLRGVTRGYLDLFRRQLRASGFDASPALPELDLPSVEMLLVSLGSGDAREASAALGVLEAEGKARLVPPLIIYHPSHRVALRALEFFMRHPRADVLPLLAALIAYGDPDRRAAALRLRHVLAPELVARPEDIEASAPATRAALLVARAGHEPEAAPALKRALEIASGDEVGFKIELARAIAEDVDPKWIPVLLVLGKSAEPDVLRAVARTARALKRVELVPTLISLLATRGVRDVARDALAVMGDEALGELGAALTTPDTPIQVRRHVPRSIARRGGARVAKLLLDRLSEEVDGMTRYKILRALGEMKVRDPSLSLDPAKIDAFTRGTVDRLVDLLWFEVSIRKMTPEPSPRRDFLLALLAEKSWRATVRLFRSFDLLEGGPKYLFLSEGIRGAAKARAASNEIVASLLDADLGETVLVLFDEIADEEKLARLASRRPDLHTSASLDRMANDRSEAVRELVAFYRAIALTDREVEHAPA